MQRITAIAGNQRLTVVPHRHVTIAAFILAILNAGETDTVYTMPGVEPLELTPVPERKKKRRPSDPDGPCTHASGLAGGFRVCLCCGKGAFL